MITAAQMGWVAGLLEGEGTFGFSNQTNGSTPSIRIGLGMNDKDVVERLANVLGFGSICIVERFVGPKNPIYRWDCSGTNAAGLMMTIYSLLGERRQARIRELLNHWKLTRPSGRGVAARKVFSFDK